MRYLLPLIWSAIPLTLVAYSVEPDTISGTDSNTGETTHPHVHCIAIEHHGLITFDLRVTDSLTEELQPFLKLNQGDRHLLTTAVGVFPKGRDEKDMIFGFTMVPEFVKDSYLDIHTKDEYLRLHLDTVPVTRRQQIDDGNAERPPGGEGTP